jgi:hypothetical protein
MRSRGWLICTIRQSRPRDADTSLRAARSQRRPRKRPGRSAWVLLDPGVFPAKIPVYGYWILLDFLGFSRPNLDLSKGYAAKTSKDFFTSFLPVTRGAAPEPAVEFVRKRRTAHRASIARFLILINLFRPRNTFSIACSPLASQRGLRGSFRPEDAIITEFEGGFLRN